MFNFFETAQLGGSIFQVCSNFQVCVTVATVHFNVFAFEKAGKDRPYRKDLKAAFQMCDRTLQECYANK
ncbi:MAG TPA: hypothetical protein PKK94_14090, partial [Leptospiraceae bacterium]|nr:hypothetical protein [Leptospiraceae bacterium]